MTNTDTADVAATVAQVQALADAGSELVRVTVNTAEAAAAVPAIRDRARRAGLRRAADRRLPLQRPQAAHRASRSARGRWPSTASIPATSASGTKRDAQFAVLIEKAIEHGKPVRIGVNWGSLDPALLARLMDDNAARARAAARRRGDARGAGRLGARERASSAEELGLPGDRIILSCKVSAVQDLDRRLHATSPRRCDYPLHLGLTEAGMGSKGIVASTAAMAVLLQQGIGDTIRVSLTPEPGGDRTREVVVAQEILQTMGLRSFTPLVTACPGCGRTTSTDVPGARRQASRPTCARRCRRGARAIPASRTCTSR